MTRKKSAFISLILLTLFVAFQVGITMFSHVHCINGAMLVHSHPSNNNQHTHTEGQLLTLAQVSSFTGIEPTCVTLEPIIFPVLQSLEHVRDQRCVLSQYAFSFFLRAPPVVFPA